jgi:hypothetical protein
VRGMPSPSSQSERASKQPSRFNVLARVSAWLSCHKRQASLSLARRGHRDEMIGKAERPSGATRSEVGYKSPHTHTHTEELDDVAFHGAL